MEIRKSNHTIHVVPKVEDHHMALAYMYGDKKIYDCNAIQDETTLGIRKVIPYERFDSYEKIFFETHVSKPESLKDLFPIFAGDYLKRDKNGYYYEPEISIKFEPLKFFYYLICQRTQSYSTQKTYNFKINCIDKESRLCDALIQIFADAPERSLVPHNIWVNSKDLSVKSLTSRPLYDNDFVFIETSDGKTYAANNQPIDYNSYFEEHVNLWLCCSNITSLEKGTANLANSVLYNEAITCDNYTFVKSGFSDKYLPIGGKTLTFFNGDAVACIVKHYQDKGYIIISSDSFIQKATKNYKMIYEVLLKVYLMAYVKSKPMNSYVCDEAVDYTVKRNQLLNHYHFKSDKPYYEYFNSYYAKDFKLIQVVLSNSKDVKVSHAPDYIYFKKVGGVTDPKKPANGYSIMLETQEIAFINKWHYIANTQIMYTTEKFDDYILLKLSPFCFNHVYSTHQVEIQVPITSIEDYEKVFIEDITYCIVYKDMAYICVDEKKWDKEGTLLLTLYIRLVKAPIELIDMRIRGGGLPENKRDNYHLLDIAHSQGRPFRKAGGYVVTLPIEVKPYHEAIMKKLEQISPGERFYTIVYEQRGDIFEND